MALNTNDACVMVNAFSQGDVYIPANTDGVVVSNVNGLITVDWTLPEGIVRNSLPSELVDSNAAKLDLNDLLAKADTALTQLATKRATFAGTPNLANAAPLLLEITDDLMAVIKAVKHIVKRIT